MQAQTWKQNDEIIDCWYDPQNPYRVSTVETENVDGFIWIVFVVFSLLTICECYTLFTAKTVCHLVRKWMS